MRTALREWTDRLLGRGSAAITVPVMDGTLKPNRVLDEAQVVAQLPDIDELASDGKALWVSAGPVLYRLDGGVLAEAARFDGPVTALACHPDGRKVVAVAGKQLRLLDADHNSMTMLDSIGGQPLVAVDALAFDGERRLLVSDGSQTRPPQQWCHDLMELGHSGRVGQWDLASSSSQWLAQGLGYAFGVLPTAAGVLVSESWRHRVVRLAGGKPLPLLAELPGYPSRMAPAADGGFWLTCFVCRTQLVEFVLREPAYRQRMIAEIDPQYWIAPALSSGHSFLEPLQGAGVKQMGVLKPWAPPRSYGLVLKVNAQGRVLRSLHSQVDGKHHGISAVAEHAGSLYVASRGSGRLLRVSAGDQA